MATQLENDLKILLPFKTDSEFIDVEKVLKDRKASIKTFYEDGYVRPEKDWKISDSALKLKSKIDLDITDVKPFYEDFTVEKFWFKNLDSNDSPYKNLKAPEGSVIGFKDGINTIFYQGNFLDGGDVYSNDDEKKGNVVSERYSKFIYAYFPPKLYLSPNNKKYFILTQGKHLLRNREQPVVRFYFNLKPDKVDETDIKLFEESITYFQTEVKNFVQTIERHLNNRRIPFQFKLPISLGNFQRADTFVLYIAQKHYYYVYEFIKNHAEKYVHILGSNTPLFTKPFAEIEGVAIAEDPDVAGDSFGKNRCTVVYEVIEKLAKNQDVKDTMTVANIITELKNRGYEEDGFFRNPFTRFNYVFSKLRPSSDLSNLSPKNTKFYMYLYGRVALNYALDLIEKAIWLNTTEITWLTYYEDENAKEKGYRLVDNQETVLIFWFLNQIIKFPWMRRRFPNNVVNIILKNSDSIYQKDDYLTRLKNEFNQSKKEYFEVEKTVEEFEFSSKLTWENVKTYAKKVEEYFDTEDNIPEEDIIKNIYEIQKGEFKDNPNLSKNAKKIYYKFLKPLYPIKNGYGNYEYIPTDKGKLQIAMIMLYVYCPSIFDSLKQPQVLAQQSPFQKGMSKFPMFHLISKLWS
jgi:HopA1 effector protein family